MNLHNARARHAGVCAVAVMAIALSACSKPVLDWRNAEVNDGLIYSGKANDPFTGQVTHVPQRFFLREQGGLEKFANVIRMSPDWNIVAIGGDELCTVSVRQGYVDGDVRCGNDENTRMSFKKGNLDGKFVYYWYGKHVADGAFDGGLPNGSQKVYGSRTGKLIHAVQWKDGLADGTEQLYSENTGKLVANRPWSDGKLDGTAEFYSDDGKQLLQQVSWKSGLKDGPVKAWSNNGDLLADTVWSEDKIVSGKARDAKGTYEYKDGQLDGPATYFGDDGTTVSSNGAYSKGKRTGLWEDRRMSPANPNIGVTRGWFSVGGFLANVPDTPRNGLLDAINKADAIKSNWIDGHLDGDVQVIQDDHLVASFHVQNAVLDGPLQYRSQNPGGGGDITLSYTFRDGTLIAEGDAKVIQEPNPLAGRDVDRCVVGWAHAFHVNAGNDAPVNADQLDEWKSWCEQGKQAPKA